MLAETATVQSVVGASEMLGCERRCASWRRAEPPTAPLFSKTISKQLFNQHVKCLAVTTKLTGCIPALGTQTRIPLPG